MQYRDAVEAVTCDENQGASGDLSGRFQLKYYTHDYPQADFHAELASYPSPPPIPAIIPDLSVTAQTQQGLISGCRQSDVFVFAGVPYAAPPTGSRRFARLQNPPLRSETLACTQFSAAWPQPQWGITDCETPTGTSEDSMYMNIWCPQNPADRTSSCPLYPVYYYCHGGAFTTGSGCAYSASTLCEETQMIIVHYNYRMGFPGFANLQDAMGFADSEGFEPNLGMKDQIHGLRWVHDNIRAFGGDSNCITIAGESAGATSVALLMIAEPAKPYFHRAIVESGGLSMALSRKKVTEGTADFLKSIGLWLEPSERTPALLAEVAQHLREYPEESIVHAWSRMKQQDYCPFGPCFDGELFPSSLETAWDEATTNDVPAMIGTTKDECNIFTECWEKCGSACVPVATHDIWSLLNRYVPEKLEDFEKFYGIVKKPCELSGEDVARSCPKGAPGNPHAKRWSDKVHPGLASDYHFHIPLKNLADRHSAHAPCYRYRLDWESPDQEGKLGAYHAYELGVLFDFTSPLERARGMHRVGSRCPGWGQRVRAIWGHFARHGSFDDNDFIKWPQYNADTRMVLALNDEHEKVIADPEGAERRSLWDDKEFHVHT